MGKKTDGRTCHVREAVADDFKTKDSEDGEEKDRERAGFLRKGKDECLSLKREGVAKKRLNR